MHHRKTTFVICVFLALITWAVFGPTLGYDFVNYDDDEYVYANSAITKGLTLKGVAWAFTHIHSSNWHPLTTISHMLDCQIYGLQPWGHHLTNVVLHGTAAIFLFLALRRMTGGASRTGDIWRSAFVATVFAIHPLRVESVAWVAERKDVLSGVFFSLTLWAYARYATGSQRSLRRYTTVVVFFAVGLMCKPTLVTLPLVLLLLDYWPLRRMSAPDSGRNYLVDLRRLVREKIPLCALSVASCVVTVLVQRESLETIDKFPFAERLGNAAVSYVAYLGQMFYPVRLAVFYPHPVGSLILWEALLALLVLLLISAACFRWRKKYPFLLIGWLWYLGMLVPMIGIIQVGGQARADRYTYLPQIGLYILAAWGGAELFNKWRHGRAILTVTSMLLITALVIRTRIQASYWHDCETLWSHALAVTSKNYLAHYNLGSAFLKKGELDKAIAHFQESIEIKPDYVEAYGNLGLAHLQKREPDEAIRYFSKALERSPDLADLHNNFGNALAQKAQPKEAIAHYEKALQIKPDYADVHNNFGSALMQMGQVDEAIFHFRKALEIKPEMAEVHNNLGLALRQTGQPDKAIAHFLKAAELRPDDPEVLDTLAATYAELGDFERAIMSATDALQLAKSAGNEELAGEIESRLDLYRHHKPYRQPGT